MTSEKAARLIAVAVGVLLVVLYAVSYRLNPALPGNIPGHPDGWWEWFDQGKTLRSAVALAHGDLRAEAHWYPLGYAVLGAPFVRLWPLHPFVLVDLACLLAAYAGFVAFARRVAVPPVWSAPLFLLSAGLDPLLFQQWVIPWNTTPAAALVWLLLAATAAELDGEGRPFRIGLLAGLVPAFRPTELLVILPCVLAAGIAILLRERRIARLGWLMLGGALPVVAAVSLHLAIYGPRASDYMTMSRDMGFSFHALGWKAYVLLVEPRTWFGGGQGLIHRAPWLALGAAGLLAAFLAGRTRALLAAVLLIHALLYVSYIDLLPIGLWRFNLAHYWVWTLPGYALLGALLLRDLARPAAPRRRFVAAVASFATMAALCLRLDPVPAAGARTFAADFAGPRPTVDQAYYGHWQAEDAEGAQRNIAAVRGHPLPGGMRVFGLRRDFTGDIRLVPDQGFPEPPMLGPPARRWAIGFGFGRPCWLLRCGYPSEGRMFAW